MDVLSAWMCFYHLIVIIITIIIIIITFILFKWTPESANKDLTDSLLCQNLFIFI